MHMLAAGNTYLNDNPVGWMLDTSESSIRYLILKDILNDLPDEADYNAITRSPAILRMCLR